MKQLFWLEILLKPYLLFAALEKTEGKATKAAVQGKKKTEHISVISFKTQWHRKNSSDSESWMTATFKSVCSPVFFQSSAVFLRATGNFQYKTGFVPLPQNWHPSEKLQVNVCPLQVKIAMLELHVPLI